MTIDELNKTDKLKNIQLKKRFMENPENIVEHKHPEKIKIIMVDDDPAFLKLLSHNIKKLYPSSDAHIFGNPVDALNFYSDNYRDIDIVIVDMLMPNMNGLELSREIKNINKNERIILMTAYSLDTMIKEKGAEAVEFFLSKTQMDPSLKNFPLLLDFYVKKILWIKDNQNKFQKAQKELHEHHKVLEQKNAAFRELLRHIELEKKEIIDNVKNNVENLLLPLLAKIEAKEKSSQYIKLLNKNLQSLTSSFGSKITEKETRLTPRELEICNMIKNGLLSKEIADLLNLTHRTLETHRTNIRKKFGLTQKKVNLTSFLKSI